MNTTQTARYDLRHSAWVIKMMNLPAVRATRKWFEPRSTNRDEAFRERTIRITVAITVILMVLVLVGSLVVFDNPWTLVSWPSLTTLLLVMSIGSGIAVARARIFMAGWILVATFMAGVLGMMLIYDSITVGLSLPGAMIVVLVGALLLPRNMIIPLGLANLAMFIIPAFFPGISPDLQSDDKMYVIANNFALIFVESLFLRQLRVEFDYRLAAMRTALHEAEMSKQEADQANQAKSQFLANMSHELRTPLNAVIGYAEIMIGGMAGVFADKQLLLIGHVHSNAKRLLDLINDILDLARVEAGRVEIIATPSSPRKIISGLVENMQSLAQKKKITLKATFSEGMPEAVVCDGSKVQQVITNLIGNSLKFTKEGGVEVIVGSTTKDNWEIKVVDTGIGMPQDAANYIFEMFRQVDSADAREHQGAGMGLAITKRLIERMGGTITVQTALGTGSTFIVTLPRVM